MQAVIRQFCNNMDALQDQFDADEVSEPVHARELQVEMRLLQTHVNQCVEGIGQRIVIHTPQAEL